MMHNLYIPTLETYQQAKKLIENDELVAFPTETIYGLGANALSDVAVKKIFVIKGRPSDNPLIIHLGSKEQIADYAIIENEIQQKIIDTLMPWPLTLLLPKKKGISEFACWVPLVGIRIPSNQIAQEFLQMVNLPIAAPSANLSWKPSPTNAQMVYDNVWDSIPMIIDGGESEAWIESTVVRVSESVIQILRPGFVTKEDLEALFNGQIRVEYTVKNPELSPGMRYKHYSIEGEVRLISNINEQNWIASSFHSSQRQGFLITQEFYDQHFGFFSSFWEKGKKLVKIRGTHSNLASCAHSLFDFYHWFDQQGIEVLYVEALPEVGIGYSIMNRVRRSAEVN